MIDKSLGKQPLIDDSGTPRPNIDVTFYHNTIHLESSAIPAPQYGMPMNFYDGQKPPEQHNANGAVRPVAQTGQTGLGGPVPTGPGALVAYQSSPEPITSMPTVQADFSRTNGFTSYGVLPYATVAYNPYTML